MSRLEQADEKKNQALHTLASLLITIRGRLQPHERKLAADQLLTLDGRGILSDQCYRNITK